MDIPSLLTEFAEREMAVLNSIMAKSYKTEPAFTIDCNDLIDYHSVDVRKSKTFKKLFDTAKDMKGPVLYLFKVVSHHGSAEIVDAIRTYKSSPNAKAVPAIKKTFPDSEYLYVGKVKKNFWGRLIHHFGYYKVPSTQGLQLHYWAPGMNLKLELTAIEFEKGTEEMLALIERHFAHKLQPIVGRH